ncbi:MAG: hypothetical protein CMF96_08620 [Candidatus Marinimicrobia bacterium]|nr:hypothetical protein [Candidatus Neomarinimicrobiota bacterium]MAJ44785.1 hypothetical protein [Candidatus Neomarinimicrobiota bacterium]|tara:strand:- start:1063 stop:2535 length:1473 start_codon:yes stop_codon:yes gene_type:complete
MSGGFGSTTIGGEIFNQISLRPEFPIGRFGIGFDIFLNIDSDGNLYKGDWNFNDFKSSARSILDKVRYIRWSNPQDSFYFRFGNLNDVNLGMGILVMNYTNALQYPSIRKIGFNAKADFGTLGIETIVSDFKYKPGLLGLRLTYKILPGLNMGLSYTEDVNQFSGLSDRDGDNYPDVFDHFPNESEQFDEAQAQSDDWQNFYINNISSTGDTTLFGEWFKRLPLNHNKYSPIKSENNEVAGYGVDFSFNLTNRLLIYTQAAKLIAQHSDSTSYSGGYGYVPIGLKYSWGPLSLLAEYRINSEHFLFNYWDKSYEVNRVIVNNQKLTTKEDRIFNYGKMKGLFIQSKLRFGNLLELKTNYTDMKGEVRENINDLFSPTEENKSFSSTLSLKSSFIPKLNKAELFYQQTNIPNPFDFELTETSIYGYNLELKISDDMILVYRSITSFIPPEEEFVPEDVLARDIEFSDNEGIFTKVKPVNIIQLQTQFLFNP